MSTAVKKEVKQKVKKKYNGLLCSYRGCDKSRSKNPELSFHKFPLDEDRRKIWVENSGMDVSKLTPQKISNKQLCCLHFKRKHIKTNRLGKSWLVNEANPIPGNTPVKLDVTDENDESGTISSSILFEQFTAYNNQQKKLKKELKLQKKRYQKITDKCKEQESIIRSQKERLKIISRKNKYLLKKVKTLKTKGIKKPTGNGEDIPENLSINQITKYCANYLKDAQLVFLTMQLKQSIDSRCYWSENEKTLALSLFLNSPKTYHVLREHFNMPCKGLVTQWVKDCQIGTETSVRADFCKYLMNKVKFVNNPNYVANNGNNADENIADNDDVENDDYAENGNDLESENNETESENDSGNENNAGNENEVENLVIKADVNQIKCEPNEYPDYDPLKCDVYNPFAK